MMIFFESYRIFFRLGSLEQMEEAARLLQHDPKASLRDA